MIDLDVMSTLSNCPSSICQALQQEKRKKEKEKKKGLISFIFLCYFTYVFLESTNNNMLENYVYQYGLSIYSITSNNYTIYR